MALLNSAVFMAGGGAILALAWLSAREIIDKHRSMLTAASVPATPPAGAGAAPPNPHPATPRSAVAAREFSAFQDEVLADLLRWSFVILVAFLALSLLATWWTARQSLGRIGRVTAAARHIGEGNLDARLALVGPQDEVKELGDTFDTMLDRLERSFTDQRRFAAHASHELRTPIALQRAALEIPLIQGRVPTDLEPDIRRALAATERSEALISALLALARGESGILTPRPTDLADLARSAITDIRAETDQNDVRLEADLQWAQVAGDITLLAQLVANLVANAVRHNVPGGSVHVRTGTTGSGAFVEVSNTGPTIDPADLPDLFKPFRRGTRRGKGSGLGLSVVRSVTDTHHGILSARPNAVGGGLTLRVDIPASGA
ncbi:sensor histidine kinase [Wenjunlia tyrosinilytica]|uniref:sensor histidine kinase n=1 Tax=Wenjunlia tyrosinilytica TaxID=1544741 RepID=UPI001666D176|nr:HAMP domain-containing sensor histidine kinase [Wenjunlia tyrosinilytica]